MAKTYNTFTNVSTGDVYTAASHNAILQNLAGYRVPPMCRVYRSSDQSGATSAFISWNAETTDTDDMWTSGDTVTVNTAGVYVVSLNVYVTCTATLSWTAATIDRNAFTMTRNQAPAYNSTSGYVSVTGIFPCSVGTTIKGVVDNFGGSAHVVKGGTDLAAAHVSSMTVAWLGQVS